MGRQISAKCKQCRREQQKLFLKGERCSTSKCALVKRSYIPGIHGPKLTRGVRLTGYGIQLREKQKAKRTYRLMEKQFRNYFEASIKKTGETGDNLFNALEIRLDNTVYRAGFAPSRDLARQAVTHGHFEVNGKKVDIPSYKIKVTDKISIKPKTQKGNMFESLAETLKNKDIPDWLTVDAKELTFTVVGEPNIKKTPPQFDLKLIIEFYSR